MFSVRPEALVPAVQNMIFDNLVQSFSTSPGYYLGTEQAKSPHFIGMISDLGKVLNRESPAEHLAERVWRQLDMSSRNFGLASTNVSLIISEYMELFFEGVQWKEPKYGEQRPTTKRLIQELCIFAATTDNSLTDRAAAYHLLQQISNPHTKTLYEEYVKTNPEFLVQERLYGLGDSAFWNQVQFPRPSLEDLKLNVRDVHKAMVAGKITQKSKLEVTLKGQGDPIVVTFSHFDNNWFPNGLYCTLDNGEQQFFHQTSISSIRYIR